MTKKCSNCRYFFINTNKEGLCHHNSVGHSKFGGLNQIRVTACIHDEKMCGQNFRFFEEKVKRVNSISKKQKFITSLYENFKK